MTISTAVELYRFLDSPKFESNTVFGVANYLHAKPYLEASAKSNFGRFEEIIVDGEEVDVQNLPLDGNDLSFEFKCVNSNSENFHESLTAFLKSDSKIFRGDLPSEFFLVEENYYSQDLEKPELMLSLFSVCEFIKHLSTLALYHDAKNGFKLVFVPTSSKGGSKSIVLDARLSTDLLAKAGVLDCGLLKELDKGAPSDPHYSEKIGVFGVTLTELYDKCGSNQNFFDYLVENWTGFLSAYHNNLAVYLSGFAFHKAKKEVAQAEFDLAAQFSKVIGDITAKLLSIPLSFAAVMVMLKSSDKLEIISVLVSLLFFGFVMREVLKNQYRHLERILHARDIVMGALEGKESDYPDELSQAINAMKGALARDEGAIFKQLRFFSWVSWGPFILAVALLIYRYWASLLEAFGAFWVIVNDYVSLIREIFCV